VIAESRCVQHYHPQQSVLKPQAEQRHTACMRYISALHRSQSIFSSLVDEVPSVNLVMVGGEGDRAASSRGRSDISGIIAYG
jgi:hypothetical protein